MSQPLAQVTQNLFDLVIDLDPARTTWERLRDTARERARLLVQQIDAQLGEYAHARLEASTERVRLALVRVKANLADLSEALDALNGTANGTRWRQLYARLAKDYDELTRAIRESRLLRDFTFKRLSPANYARSAFHVIGGVTGALAYHYLLDRTGALIIMTVFVTVFSALELLRRRSAEMNDLLMRFPFFRRIARPHEYYRVNSSTYYAWGMLIAVLVAPRQAVEAACLVLAFGDPVASNLGRKFGRRKLFRDKSWVGTAAFFAAAFTVLLAYQLLLYSAQPLRLQVLVAFTGAMVGALIELFTVRLDDNFTVPLSVALGVGIFLEAAGAAAV